MPDKIVTPVAPVTTAPTPTPAAAPVSAPAVTPAAAAPKVTPPRGDKGKFVSPTAPPPIKRNSVPASRVLKTGNTKKEVQDEIDKARKRMEGQTPVTLRYEEPKPAAPEPVVPPVVEPPAAPTPVPTPAAPPEPQKVKIGDREYTTEELADVIKKQQEAAAPAPAPAPQAPPTPSAPAMTPEQVVQKENEWISVAAKSYEPPVTAEALDQILTGGPEGLAKLKELLQHVHAAAHLQARKSIFGDVAPKLQAMHQTLEPIVHQHQELARYQIEQKFVSKHKDFVPQIERAKHVATELARLYPQQVAQMSEEQFIDEVARQTDVILTNEHKRWFPTGNGNWRQTVAPVPAPVVPTPTPAPAAAPVAPGQAAPAVRPPSGNAPGGFPTGGKQDWSKGVASTLRG